jgi:hypothetical protein
MRYAAGDGYWQTGFNAEGAARSEIVPVMPFSSTGIRILIDLLLCLMC